MLTCDEATRLLSERRERPLTLREKMSLRLHTAMCSACRTFGTQVDELGDMMRSFRDRDDA